MNRAQRLVEQLLEEAVPLLPFRQWDLDHIEKRFRMRWNKIPFLEQGTHLEAISEMFSLFKSNWGDTCAHLVGDGDWQMPLPLGWRLLGKGNQAKTIFSPSETSAAEWIENPLLPHVYRAYWRKRK